MSELFNASEITLGGKDVAKIEMKKNLLSNFEIVWEKSTPPPPPHKLFVKTYSFHQQLLNYYIEIDDEVHFVDYFEDQYDISNAKKLCWGPSSGNDYNVLFVNENLVYGGNVPYTITENKCIVNLESIDYPPNHQNIYLAVDTII